MKPNYTLIAETCHLTRTYQDILVDWNNVLNKINYHANNQDEFAKHHGPGHFFDPGDQIFHYKLLTNEHISQKIK